MTSRKRPPVKVEVVIAEGLVVGPTDTLLLRLPHDGFTEEIEEGLMKALGDVGLQDRTLVLFGDIEMGKVEPTE